MSRCAPITVFCWLWIVLGLSPPSIGKESSSKDKPKRNYAELISQLVSPNKKPTTGVESVKFPAGYNVQVQQRIKATRQILQDNIEEALPYLVDALDDPRYCMTINWAEGDGYYNKSVGAICKDVIASQLEVYRDAISFSGPHHWHKYNYPISKKWWEMRKGHRIAELQVEAIDWAIKQRMAEPEKEIRDDRKNEVAELQKLRDGIAKSGKPAKPSGMLRMVTSDH
jgi:hypothetical protein